MNKPEKFWMITGHMNGPKKRHHYKADAVTEAERLATQHPGQMFFVLEAVTVICKESVVVQDL